MVVGSVVVGGQIVVQPMEELATGPLLLVLVTLVLGIMVVMSGGADITLLAMETGSLITMLGVGPGALIFTTGVLIFTPGVLMFTPGDADGTGAIAAVLEGRADSTMVDGGASEVVVDGVDVVGAMVIDELGQ